MPDQDTKPEEVDPRILRRIERAIERARRANGPHTLAEIAAIEEAKERLLSGKLMLRRSAAPVVS